ncbi:NADH-quinone oxidoreductase subunit M [Phycisphaerae bacterium RAS1]|nr:NADH-quinone oxidoreductase subunit M [Phycisphaerae bacterium RAS1]
MDALFTNLLVFLPLIAAVIVWTLPARREASAGPLAFWVGLLTALLSIYLWMKLPAVGPKGLVGEFRAEWITIGDYAGSRQVAGVQVRYHVGMDAISGPLIALTGVLVPLSIACSFTSIRTRVREYYAWMLALTAAMFGVFLARDLLLFYVFFEFTLIPLYFLIGIWGGAERRYAATKFFLYTFVGSVVTFAGILYLAVRSAGLRGVNIIDFDLQTLSSLALSGQSGLTLNEQSLLFIAFFCGFAIKVPFFPLHTWLPLAHTEAPTAGSVLLAGVLLKLGTYGFLRFTLPVVPDGAIAWASAMGVLAVAGIIYGALCSWVQRDVKKLVAYSSVSHLGFCMLGMFSLLPVGVSGSVLYMVNHGISTGALFLMVGMIYERYHTRDMDQIGGLARRMPVAAFFLVLFVLSSVGLPGLNGFVSEFTVLLAAFNATKVLGPWFGSIGAAGILLGAIYLLYMTGKVLFGPLKEPPHTPDLSAGLKEDLTKREVAILLPLAVLVVLLGAYPRIITDTLDPALRDQILARTDSRLAMLDHTAPLAQHAGADDSWAGQRPALPGIEAPADGGG